MYVLSHEALTTICDAFNDVNGCSDYAVLLGIVSDCMRMEGLVKFADQTYSINPHARRDDVSGCSCCSC